jgi:hypothetical protein
MMAPAFSAQCTTTFSFNPQANQQPNISMKKTPYSTSLGRILAAVSGSLVLVSGITQIHAADRTWNGGGDQTSWTDAANWGGTAPVAPAFRRTMT